MALDSRQKRAAVVGVGRAWYRNPHPSSVDASQRASIGQVYPVAAFQAALQAAVGKSFGLATTFTTTAGVLSPMGATEGLQGTIKYTNGIASTMASTYGVESDI